MGMLIRMATNYSLITMVDKKKEGTAFFSAEGKNPVNLKFYIQ